MEGLFPHFLSTLHTVHPAFPALSYVFPIAVSNCLTLATHSSRASLDWAVSGHVVLVSPEL